MSKPSRAGNGFTLVELLVVIAIIGVLVGLLLPAVQAAFRYEPWLTQIPTLRCPSDPGEGLPGAARTNYAAGMGDSPYLNNQGLRATNGNSNSTMAQNTRAASRGVFVPRMVTKFRDITDGMSNTIAAGEVNSDLNDNNITTRTADHPTQAAMLRNPSACQQFVDPRRPRFWGPGAPLTSQAENRRGLKWALGYPLFTSVNMILPPNRELCYNGDATSWGVVPPSSRHQGGVHVLMADGAVIFVTDSIEAGDSTHEAVWRLATDPKSVPGSPSPYGLWGALGTRAANEVIDEQLN